LDLQTDKKRKEKRKEKKNRSIMGNRKGHHESNMNSDTYGREEERTNSSNTKYI
jgi:hypothetical protein